MRGSAQSEELCHQVDNGAGCVLSSRASRPLSILVDTGCDRTLLPRVFNKYIVSGDSSSSTTVELAGKGQVLRASSVKEVLMPVLDINGAVRMMKELFNEF